MPFVIASRLLAQIRRLTGETHFTCADQERAIFPNISTATAGTEKLGSRLQFVAQTMGNLDPHGSFDLITACDCIHDFARPQET
jgi:2-polyprenyl-3-methyl-5-hydroxy-6-metoxy-1,4-benzoquinol methylase